MPDLESQDPSVLGKRPRYYNGDLETNEYSPNPPSKVEDDDSDDDFGPKPMPIDSAVEVVKKKRKGTCIFVHQCWQA